MQQTPQPAPTATPTTMLNVEVPSQPPLMSPDVRLTAVVPLPAPIVAAAMPAAPPGSHPRFIAAADANGALHLLDGTGRALRPPTHLVAPPSRIVGLAFMGSSPSEKTPPTTAVMAAAVAFDDLPTGFGIYLFRIAPARNPTPDERAALELVVHNNITWPDADLAGAVAAGGDGASSAGGGDAAADVAVGADTSGGGAIPSTPPPPPIGRLVGIEGMQATSAKGAGKGGKGAPAFLALRSDGVLVTVSTHGALITGVAPVVSTLLGGVRNGGTLALLSPQSIVLLEVRPPPPPYLPPTPYS